jgi:nitrite reductase (NADH) large subunit
MATRWLCTVCGYVHEGDEPPEACPLCGATAEYFEQLEDQEEAGAVAAPERWSCLNCDYVHEGQKPPAICPVCAVDADQFEAVVVVEKGADGEGMSGTIVIVGGGIAGLSAAEAARATSPEARLILLTSEQELPYYRLNLTRYLAGELPAEELSVHPNSWYEEKQIEIRFATEVTAIDPVAKQLRLKDNGTLGYDRLIMAMGAHPFVPPIVGAKRHNVVCLRHKKDADLILANCLEGSRCVVVGGGILGLEIAAALARRKIKISMLEGFGWLLPRQLNQRASSYLETAAKGLDIDLILNARIKQFDGDESVRGVLLESGDLLAADMVIIAAGVRCNSYLARLAGLEVNDGVIVDNHLRTSDPAIFAAGDLAEHQSVCYGTWAPAQFQGSIAGINAAGGEAAFGGIPRSNILKVLGVDMLSIGQVHPDDASFQSFELAEQEQYAQLIFRDNRLVGGILVGDTVLAPKIKKLIESRHDCRDLLKGAKDVKALFNSLAAFRQ